MKAFNNDQKIKEFYLARVLKHQEADEIIKGKYWEDGKGCAVGCTLHSSKHISYESELGIPVEIAILQDNIFEGLENSEAKFFPYKFLNSIKIGADLSLVFSKFLIWSLTDKKNGVINFTKKEEIKEAIRGVAKLYKRKIERIEPDFLEWIKASSNAANAANAYAYAANAYAYAAAANANANAAANANANAYAAAANANAAYAAAAYAAADANAAYAAAAAANAAACYDSAPYSYADAYDDARNGYRLKQMNKLIELLKEA